MSDDLHDASRTTGADLRDRTLSAPLWTCDRYEVSCQIRGEVVGWILEDLAQSLY